ncbi:Peptidase S1, PA clan,Serine proteases, trypsin domain [Cinara cedri]|uniref:Peptidase S1, PA clan,Serine proteases, trypsin domain n=1 Tax=Cinara cedri TaxID=506608 RepID=A0A5E4N983_9HEMI|nr:Peptidase S1, PA clan,Serine proteases, trypsin domain [Cinara cedri]
MKTIVSLFLILTCFTSAKNIGHDKNDESLITPEINLHYMPMPSSFYIAAMDEFPFQVAILLSDSETHFHDLICQGVLVSHNWILTTASCILQFYGQVDIKYIKVFLGTVDFRNVNFGFVRKVNFFMFHPDYNLKNNDGKDLAMWMISDGVSRHTLNTDVAYLFDASGTKNYDCKYITFSQAGYLYGAPATLSNNSNDCVKIVDDISHCVKINNTIYEELHVGASLICGGKLYALKNYYGYFTTVYDTSSWILYVIDVGLSAVRKEKKLSEKEEDISFIEYGYEDDFFDFIQMRIDWNNKNLNLSEESTREIKKEYRRKQEDNENDVPIDEWFHDSQSESDWSESNERGLRKRRFAQTGAAAEIEHLFSSWAITVSKLNIERQIDLKINIGNIVANAERDYLEEQTRLKEIEESYIASNESDMK